VVNVVIQYDVLEVVCLHDTHLYDYTYDTGAIPEVCLLFDVGTTEIALARFRSSVCILDSHSISNM